MSAFNTTISIDSHFSAKADNITSYVVDRQKTTFKAIQAVILILFMLAGFVGNTCVCVFMLRTRELRTRTNSFYVSLSVANIGIAVISIPFTIISSLTGKWSLGTELCRINGVVNPFWITALCLSVTATTIHKYLSITRPLHNHVTDRRLYLMIFSVWWTSALVSIWPIVHSEQIVYKAAAGHCGYSPSDRVNEVYYLLVLACAVFLCPTFINTYCYLAMFRVLRRHRQRIRQSTVIDVSGIRTQRRNIVTLYVVFIMFFITWLPVNIYSILFASSREDLLPDWTLAVAYICAYSTCVQIPFVIIYRSARLRSDFKQLMSAIICDVFFRTGSLRIYRDSNPYESGVDRRCSAWYVTNDRPGYRPRAISDTFVTGSFVNGNHLFDESKF